MKNDTQLKVQAYLDNELSPGEARKVASLISSDTEARDLYHALQSTKQFLEGNEPEVKLQESRDFYWSKIQRGIESAERMPKPSAATSWWVKLLAPLAGAAALLALLLSVAHPGDGPTSVAQSSPEDFIAERASHEVEDLNPDVSTITFHSEAEGVTVVWVTTQQ